MLTKLEKSLTDFLALGKSPYEISQGLEPLVDARIQDKEYCAFRLARTETAHLQIKAQTDKYREMGYTHGIWVAQDPCDECGDNDGKRFTLAELESAIPNHPNCECSFLLDLER